MSYYNDLADDLIEAMNQEKNGYQVLDHGHVIYLDHMGTDRTITDAARISTNSEPDAIKDKQLLMRLYRDRHSSPFEMCKISFRIKLPIFIMRQFVRHRMQNLNETSARYRELPGEFYIPRPENWRVQDKSNRQHTVKGEVKLAGNYPIRDVDGTFYGSSAPSTVLSEHCEKSYLIYKDMLASGAGRELARMCLPLNIYTEIVCCWDLRNLLHFFSLRLDEHAQLEMQAYAAAMYNITKQWFPWTIEAYERFPIMTIDRNDARV